MAITRTHQHFKICRQYPAFIITLSLLRFIIVRVNQQWQLARYAHQCRLFCSYESSRYRTALISAKIVVIITSCRQSCTAIGSPTPQNPCFSSTPALLYSKRLPFLLLFSPFLSPLRRVGSYLPPIHDPAKIQTLHQNKIQQRKIKQNRSRFVVNPSL